VASITDDPLQRDLDYAAMRDDEDIAVLVFLKNLIEGGGNPHLEIRSPLTSRHEVPIGFLDPARPRVGKSSCDLVRCQTFPLAEINLAKQLFRLGLGACGDRDGFGGLERPFQVARVKACKSPAGKPEAKAPGLLPAFLGKRRVELALDAPLAVPGRLAVADQQQARRLWLGLSWSSLVRLGGERIGKLNGRAGLSRVRARSFDLDIYTNFLFNPVGLGRSQEKDSCSHMAR